MSAARSDGVHRSTRSHRLFRPSRRIRIGIVQVVCGLIGLALGLIVPRADLGPPMDVPVAIQTMLTMGFGVVGLITVIFSLLFTVVQWVYGTFSQRLRLFEEHWLTWWVFGLAIGVFVYTLVASFMLAARGSAAALVPGVAFVAVLASLVMVRQLQLVAFSSVQLAPTLLRLSNRGLEAFEELYGGSGRASDEESIVAAGGSAQAASPTELLWLERPIVLQQVDAEQLAVDAHASGSVIRMHAAVGHTLYPGRPYAESVGGSPDPLRIRRTLEVGAERTFDQDPLLAVRLAADIALRALSPAVNDPATAVQAMDVLDSLLISIADRNLAVGRLVGPEGEVVVSLAMPEWEDFLAEGLDDLVVCASALPLSAHRLERLLDSLLAASPPQRQPAVERRIAALRAQTTARAL